MNEDQVRVCSLCGEEFTGFGNNPEPLARYEERCCDECNTFVVAARLKALREFL